MKNKKLFATFALVLSSVILCSCGNDASSIVSTSSNDNTSSQTSSSSSSTLPVINLEDSDLYYLCGTFYGKDGTLKINSKKANLTNESKQETLTPTSVKNETISSDLKTLTLYFDEAYNNGITYRAYVDLEGDGFLHFQAKVDGKYVEYATYQPSIAKYQGVYSTYGDSDFYNTYYVITDEFDFARNGFVTDHVNSGSWSYEQSWLGKTRIRGTKENSYITYEEYDSDGDGWGESQLVMEENRVRFYDPTYDYNNSVTDFGLIQDLQVFDGTNTISIYADLEEGTLNVGDKQGTLSILKDDNGFYVESEIDAKKVKIRIFHHYITYEEDGKVSVYPINDTSEMEGTFTDKTNTISYSLDWETDEYSLTFNGESVDFSYVVFNNRKAISFVKDGKTYIVTPDKSETSIKVSVDNVTSYYLNDESFSEIFNNTYYVHNNGVVSEIKIDADLSYTIGNEKGQGTYSFSHGVSYPTLKLGNRELSIINYSIGLFEYNDGTTSNLVYTKAALEKVYGVYSSNGQDSLEITDEYVKIGDKEYEYDFTTYVPSENGLKQFALALKGTDYVVASNLYGTIVLIEDDIESKYYVYKDVFEDIAGTYSAYGTYGIENIKFTKEGVLTLDTTNSDSTGLDRDVQYPYYIVTNEQGDYIAQIIFTYKNNKIALNVYEDHVSIGSLNYYKSALTNSWGIYTDETMSNIVFIRDGSLYVNGTSVTYTSVTEDESKITYKTSTGSLVITKGDTYSAVYTDGETVTNLTRSLDYTNYNKAFSNTYTINDATLVFSKDSTGLGYQTVIDEYTTVTFEEMNVSIKDGGICLEIPTSSCTYYLTYNLKTSEVSTSYEASSIPTPPPFPSL